MNILKQTQNFQFFEKIMDQLIYVSISYRIGN